MSGPTTTAPIIVDIYCRTATSSQQDSTRLEEQEQICREYCVAQGLTVGLVNYDSLSGLQFRERMALNRMRNRYHDGTIQGVVVTILDRLSRSNIHLAILLNEMELHNTALHIVQGPLEKTVQGRYLLALSSFITEVEREKALEFEKGQ